MYSNGLVFECVLCDSICAMLVDVVTAHPIGPLIPKSAVDWPLPWRPVFIIVFTLSGRNVHPVDVSCCTWGTNEYDL